MTSSVSELPRIPENWRDDYSAFESRHWIGWMHNSLHDGDPGFDQDPSQLFSGDRVQKWLKQHRNLLAEVRWPGTNVPVVLKKYGAKSMMNSLRLKRGLPRAIRHWNNAWMLKERGINTPTPVFLGLKKNEKGQGLIAVEPVTDFVHIRDLFPRNGSDVQRVRIFDEEIETLKFVEMCGRYVREVHDAGLVHRDLSGANILIPKTWNSDSNQLKSEFILIDINRVRTVDANRMTMNLRIQDLERLVVPDKHLENYFMSYANGDAEIVDQYQKFLKYRLGYRRMRRTKNPLMRGILKTFTYWPRTG